MKQYFTRSHIPRRRHTAKFCCGDVSCVTSQQQQQQQSTNGVAHSSMATIVELLFNFTSFIKA